MKRPVWTFKLLRDTNAPLDLVAAHLRTSPGTWHPRHGAALRLEAMEDGRFLHRPRPRWGVEELEVFEARVEGDRVLLEYQVRFKGWPVLLLLGWWRLRSHRLWERFVAELKPLRG